MRVLKHFAAVAVTVLTTTMLGSAAVAQTWPSKPVTIIVPLPPGGPVNAVAREFARHLADDTITGFTPNSVMLEYANVLVVHPSVPATSVAELVSYAKQNPGKVSYASSGFGSSNHLSGELLAQQTGTTMLHVPYKGTAPGRTDTIAGHVSIMFDVVSSAMPYIQSGQLKPIATTGKQRNSALPDVPTVAETLKDFEVTGWFALYSPPNLPENIAGPLNAAIVKALKKEESATFLKQTG